MKDHHAFYRQRNCTGHPSHNLVSHVMTIPEDVERVEVSEPCTYCGVARGGCKHRPWMLDAAA